MPSPLDPFIPEPQAREYFAIGVAAPAGVVFDTARNFDIQSVRFVAAIFALREKLMGAHPPPRVPKGFIDEMKDLGWGTLEDQASKRFIAGAVCQPWVADVVFHPVAREQFRSFTEPGWVKIAWSIEVTAVDGGYSRLATETRAVATDESSKVKFARYWRWARFGILPIRWLLLPAVRRKAERYVSDQRLHADRSTPRE